MKLRFASVAHAKDGWVLSYDLLMAIQKHIDENFIKIDDIPSLEQIEAVLLAFRMESKEG